MAEYDLFMSKPGHNHTMMPFDQISMSKMRSAMYLKYLIVIDTGLGIFFSYFLFSPSIRKFASINRKFNSKNSVVEIVLETDTTYIMFIKKYA